MPLHAYEESASPNEGNARANIYKRSLFQYRGGRQNNHNQVPRYGVRTEQPLCGAAFNTLYPRPKVD